MLTTIFNHTTAKALLLTGLLLGVVGIETVPATGQMVAPGQFTSSSAQQAIYAFARNLSPYEQQLVVNALRKLGPRAGAEVARLVQISLAVPGGLSLLGPRVITPALQSIPAQYHQAFVDGVFRVSLAEEQFSVQVMSRLMQAQQMQAGYH